MQRHLIRIRVTDARSLGLRSSNPLLGNNTDFINNVAINCDVIYQWATIHPQPPQ